MDCCSADGYAATYTELLKKVTGNNSFWMVFVIFLPICVFLLCKSLSTSATAKKNI